MEGVDIVAQLMAIAATTAPKAKGENFIGVKVLSGEAVAQLGLADGLGEVDVRASLPSFAHIGEVSTTAEHNNRQVLVCDALSQETERVQAIQHGHV